MIMFAKLIICVFVISNQISSFSTEQPNFILLKIAEKSVDQDLAEKNFNSSFKRKPFARARSFKTYGGNSTPWDIENSREEAESGYRSKSRAGKTQCNGVCIQGECDFDSQEKDAKLMSCDVDEDCKKPCDDVPNSNATSRNLGSNFFTKYILLYAVFT